MKRKVCCVAMLVIAAVSLSSCMGRNPLSLLGDTSTAESTEEADTRYENTTVPKDKGTTESDVTENVNDEQAMRLQLYSGFRQILTEKEAAIKAITWQTATYRTEEGLDYSGYGYLDERIAFYDLTGDGLDEMVVLYGVDDDTYSECVRADLDIYGYNQGTVVCLYHADSFEVQVAGGTRFAMLAMEGNQFLIYDSMGDESWEQSYTVMQWNGSDFAEVEKIQYLTGPNDDHTAIEESYLKNGNPSDGAEYIGCVQTYSSKECALLLQDMIDDDAVYDMARAVPNKAVSYDSAQAYLDTYIAALGGTPVGDELFVQIAGSYVFSSGVGGWGTYLDVNPDGTFTGNYHDSDMGDIGDGYPNGTMYVCDFSGKFKNPVQEPNGNYIVELDYLDYSGQGTVEIQEGVRYVYSEPYGVSGSDLFEIYPVGTPTSAIPQGYMEWVAMLHGWGDDDLPDTLPFNGIYNIMQQEGFGQ